MLNRYGVLFFKECEGDEYHVGFLNLTRFEEDDISWKMQFVVKFLLVQILRTGSST